MCPTRQLISDSRAASHVQLQWFAVGVLSAAALGFSEVARCNDDVGSGDTRPFGLVERVPFTTSRVVGSPDPPHPYRIRRVFEDVELEQPVFLIQEPGSERLFLIEYGKRQIVTLANRHESTTTELFLAPERNVYSIAFHPRYVENRFLYVFTNGPTPASRAEYDERVAVDPDGTHDPAERFNHITRYEVDQDSGACDLESALLIFDYSSNGHDGGDIAFGPDGKLYMSSGDGTGDSDGDVTGQDISDLTSGMIRIDVDNCDAGRNYGIPADNPFLDTPGARGELWAFGFRNPWRMSFDRATGRLWVGDVGQDLWEMIYLCQRGGNYGWSVMEGNEPFRLQRQRGPAPISGPIVAHPHSVARSITGGIVYHGERLTELQGAYIYADHETGKIWGLRYDSERVTWHEELDDISHKITSFGTDRDDELYMLALGGEIFVLDRETDDDADAEAFPRRLSETGLFDSVADHTMAPGVIPYTVNAPLWSDGAIKDRYMAIPADGQITYSATGAWVLPEQTVLVKTFALEMDAGNVASRRRLETRLLTLQQNEWVGYTYLWNEQQTDAELVDRDGLDRTYTVRDANGATRQQTWHFPGRTECMVCHSRAAGFVLGPHGPQMNKLHDYGGVVDNQIRAYDHIGLFDAPLDVSPDESERLVDPYDTTVEVDARARSYLQGNCAHCHVMAGGGNSRMILSHATVPEEMFIFDVRPQHDRFGIADAAIVASGAPERSVLYHRMATLGTGRMPPLASVVVDERAVAMLAQWIRSHEPAEVNADNEP